MRPSAFLALFAAGSLAAAELDYYRYLSYPKGLVP